MAKAMTTEARKKDAREKIELIRERADPARWLLRGSGPGAITVQAQPSGRSLPSGPPAG
jgi:hypothetical protein